MSKSDPGNRPRNTFLKKYIIQKVLWTVFALLVVVSLNVLIKKYGGGISLGIFPAELFMMIYQSKAWGEYLFIVFFLGLISSMSGFFAFLAGRYFNDVKAARLVILQKKFKQYGDLFKKYGWVILILAATTPLPFAMISFIAGYFKFSSPTFLKMVVPVRISRFFVSAYLIKYSISVL